MSRRYKGAVISATPPTTTGGESGTAPGEWTLQQQAQAQSGGIWPTPPTPKYIEDVFSTYLYTGTGANQSIVNGIDLSTKGGLVWTKDRSSAVNNNLVNTVAGNTQYLVSNNTGAQQTTSPADNITSFNTNGYSLGADTATNQVNYFGEKYVSWTFRKQPKFFDVVTYTGNGTTQNIAHSLAGTVGTLIIKRTDAGGSNWLTYHRSLPADEAVALNTTQASSDYYTPTIFGNNTVSVAPTSTQFTVGNYSAVNASGGTYVAYLFAHNAGGFGLLGTDNVISCGSFTSGVNTNNGWEPQYILLKFNGVSQWFIWDTMRGLLGDDSLASQYLQAQSSAAEASSSGIKITSTGFTYAGASGIYIAIRRGPMKVPTDATKVFNTFTGGDFTPITTGFPVDAFLDMYRPSSLAGGKIMASRLTGSQYLITSSTNAEATNGNPILWDSNTTVAPQYLGYSGTVVESFRRAPSFFDEVCYTGTGNTTTNINHSLSVVPELIILKVRNSATDGNVTWAGWWVTVGNASSAYLFGPSVSSGLNSTGAGTALGSGWFVSPNFTSTSFNPFYVTVSSGSEGIAGNVTGKTYVAYLFATCPGVSKVGTYTGNGTTQAIACGFAGGARFVLIKRTDSTGDWYVYDTSRGMTTLTDPYLLLNSTAAESATLGSVTTTTGGFTVNASILAAINTSAASYIFLAIA